MLGELIIFLVFIEFWNYSDAMKNIDEMKIDLCIIITDEKSKYFFSGVLVLLWKGVGRNSLELQLIYLDCPYSNPLSQVHHFPKIQVLKYLLGFNIKRPSIS